MSTFKMSRNCSGGQPHNLPPDSQSSVCSPVGFRVDRVPPALDAVVIGSGVGGLTAAALLSKAGKKVAVLEQHDQAGGCTHTFQNKGFEFDVGKEAEYANKHAPAHVNVFSFSFSFICSFRFAAYWLKKRIYNLNIKLSHGFILKTEKDSAE